MEKQLIARGQATIVAQQDAYTLRQSVSEYVFTADNNGTIAQAATFASTIQVRQGNDNVTNFTIGTIAKPAGFSAVSVNNADKTITYSVAAGTTAMADSGIITIPVLIAGQTYHLSFSYAKAKTGAAGIDANLLDWVKDWNSGKTVVGGETLITPKIFAGTKNSNNTVTGIAIGKFSLATVNASGNVSTETVNGIYGFKNGKTTFSIDTGGSVQLGNGNQFIKYNASTGKVEFGTEVSLHWIGATYINKDGIFTGTLSAATLNAVSLKASQITSGVIDAARIDTQALKSALITAGNIEALALDVTRGKVGGWDIAADTVYHSLNGRHVILKATDGDSPLGSHRGHRGLTLFVDEGHVVAGQVKVVQMGALANPNTVNTWSGETNYGFRIMLRGGYDIFRADNAGATIAGWKFDADSLYRGTKKNLSTGYTAGAGHITIGNNGIRGFKWRLEADGSGALAAGAIAWDTTGNVTLSDKVKIQWVDKKINDIRIGGRNYVLNSSCEWKTYSSFRNVINETVLHYRVNAFDWHPGDVITVSFDWQYTDVVAGANKYLNLQGSGNVTGWTNGFPGYNIRDKMDWETGTGEIHISYSFTFTEARAANDFFSLNFRHDYFESGSVAIRNFKIEKGNKETAWTPAPEDAQSRFESLTTALGGASYPKLTRITATGIYTGSIATDQLDAASIRSDIINTDYISGLSCAFTKGTIGGWTINGNSLSSSHLVLDNGHRSITVYGKDSSPTSGARVQLYYNNDYDFGIKVTNISGEAWIEFGETNRIAGWIVTGSQIYKNNVCLDEDGSIRNGSLWRLENDGSGSLAGGNIRWNASGGVTFSPAVALNWTDAIDAIRIGGANLLNNSGNWQQSGWNGGFADNGGGYALDPAVLYNGKPTIRTDTGTGIVHRNWVKLDAETEYTYSAMVRCDKAVEGTGLYPLHYWSGTDNVNMGKISVLDHDTSVKAGTWKRIYIVFRLSRGADSFRPFFYRGTNDGTFYNIAYMKLEKGNKTTDWSQSDEDHLMHAHEAQQSADAIASALGGAAFPKLTHITQTGIYTGTLTARQVNAVAIDAGSITTGTLDADRIAAGSIKADKLDAAGIRADIINAAYINGLTCNFTRGKIGGWEIGWSLISAGSPDTGHRINMTSSGYIYHDDPSTSVDYWGLKADGGATFCKGKVSFNADGSGRLAAGNISWDISGNVRFAESVAVLWQREIDEAKELARAMAFGKMLFRDPEFSTGFNGTSVYLANTSRSYSSDIGAPTPGHHIMTIGSSDWNTASDLRAGGFSFGNQSRANAVFLVRILAKIPLARRLEAYHNAYGDGGTTKWLTTQTGTGKYEEYLCKVTCGGVGSFSTVNYFALTGGFKPTREAPVIWHVAYATVFDITAAEKYTTTLDANGIYTGKVSAGQIDVDTALVVGGRTYNGSISVRNADNSIVATLDRTGITAVAGKIGGWMIDYGAIYASSAPSGHRTRLSGSGYFYNDDGVGKDYWGLQSNGSATFAYGKVSFSNTGSGFVAGGNISWDAAGNITAKGGTFNDVVINGTIRNAFKLNDSSVWLGGDASQQINLNKCDHIVAVQEATGGWRDPDIVIPWTLEHSGRRVCLVNYKWRNKATLGYMQMTAPSGKFFFEDGISKRVLTFSRELVELLGYGDDTTFFGWIVVNRVDLMTTHQYGSNAKVLYSGIVTNGTMTKRLAYDGSSLTCSRTGAGTYRVNLPASLGADNYTVMLTGIAYNGLSVYATLTAKYSSYFEVRTADDSSNNDGSFTFQVISTGNWL